MVRFEPGTFGFNNKKAHQSTTEDRLAPVLDLYLLADHTTTRATWYFFTQVSLVTYIEIPQSKIHSGDRLTNTNSCLLLNEFS